MKCDICLKPLTVSAVDFRGKYYCRTGCYNQRLRQLQYVRERREGRWQLRIDSQKLGSWWKRGWIYIGDLIFGWEYNLWTNFCHVYISGDDGEKDVTIGIAFPPLALWLYLEVPWQYRLHIDRQLELSVHHGTIWWDIWTDRDRQFGIEGNWNVLDWLFGEVKHTEKRVWESGIRVMMPEGIYIGQGVWKEVTTWRHRLGCLTRRIYLRVDVEMDKEIPFPSNSAWNLEEDALHSISMRVDGISNIGVANQIRERVMENRERYPL